MFGGMYHVIKDLVYFDNDQYRSRFEDTPVSELEDKLQAKKIQIRAYATGVGVGMATVPYTSVPSIIASMYCGRQTNVHLQKRKIIGEIISNKKASESARSASGNEVTDGEAKSGQAAPKASASCLQSKCVADQSATPSTSSHPCMEPVTISHPCTSALPSIFQPLIIMPPNYLHFPYAQPVPHSAECQALQLYQAYPPSQMHPAFHAQHASPYVRCTGETMGTPSSVHSALHPKPNDVQACHPPYRPHTHRGPSPAPSSSSWHSQFPQQGVNTAYPSQPSSSSFLFHSQVQPQPYSSPLPPPPSQLQSQPDFPSHMQSGQVQPDSLAQSFAQLPQNPSFHPFSSTSTISSSSHIVIPPNSSSESVSYPHLYSHAESQVYPQHSHYAVHQPSTVALQHQSQENEQASSIPLTSEQAIYPPSLDSSSTSDPLIPSSS